MTGLRLPSIKNPYPLLRCSLGLVYVWFGALKLAGMSPAVELIRGAYPAFASEPLYGFLSLFEVLVGIALLLGGAISTWAAAAVALHIAGTFGVLVLSPQTAFLPSFPFLTMEGEFVAKNLVLLAAALVLLSDSAKHAEPLTGNTSPFRRIAFILGAAGVLSLTVATEVLHDERLQAAAASTRAGAAHVSAGHIATLISSKDTLATSGTVTDRCQLMGCWLKLEDSGSELFVDLASSEVSARSVPVGYQVRVWGRIGKTRLGTVGFVANSLEIVKEAARATLLSDHQIREKFRSCTDDASTTF